MDSLNNSMEYKVWCGHRESWHYFLAGNAAKFEYYQRLKDELGLHFMKFTQPVSLEYGPGFTGVPLSTRSNEFAGPTNGNYGYGNNNNNNNNANNNNQSNDNHRVWHDALISAGEGHGMYGNYFGSSSNNNSRHNSFAPSVNDTSRSGRSEGGSGANSGVRHRNVSQQQSSVAPQQPSVIDHKNGSHNNNYNKQIGHSVDDDVHMMKDSAVDDEPTTITQQGVQLTTMGGAVNKKNC